MCSLVRALPPPRRQGMHLLLPSRVSPEPGPHTAHGGSCTNTHPETHTHTHTKPLANVFVNDEGEEKCCLGPGPHQGCGETPPGSCLDRLLLTEQPPQPVATWGSLALPTWEPSIRNHGRRAVRAHRQGCQVGGDRSPRPSDCHSRQPGNPGAKDLPILPRDSRLRLASRSRRGPAQILHAPRSPPKPCSGRPWFSAVSPAPAARLFSTCLIPTQFLAAAGP